MMRFSPSEKMHVTKIKEQIPALAIIVLEATKQMGIGAPMALISGSTPDLSHLTHFFILGLNFVNHLVSQQRVKNYSDGLVSFMILAQQSHITS